MQNKQDYIKYIFLPTEDGSFSLPKQLEDISPATEFPNVQHRWNTNEVNIQTYQAYYQEIDLMQDDLNF